MPEVKIREADSLELTVLVDNYTDLLLFENKGVMRRSLLRRAMPLAEHGLSVLIKAEADGQEHHFLFDAGLSPAALLNNLRVFQVDVEKIEGVILSHGHVDHFGGLMGFLENASKPMKLVVHPEAFRSRRLNIPGAREPREMPSLKEADLEQAGAMLHKVREPSTWGSDLILVLGEIERKTDFEKGFPWAEVKMDDQWMVDPFDDDRGVAFHVKGRGLVVIGGCSHAGIVNTIIAARQAAGVHRVHAVLGGFHLAGSLFEPIIEPTIAAIKEFDPDHVMPMHCTGWRAIQEFSRAMPEQFYLTTVGTRYVFD